MSVLGLQNYTTRSSKSALVTNDAIGVMRAETLEHHAQPLRFASCDAANPKPFPYKCPHSE
jgi:hypothetical protein